MNGLNMMDTWVHVPDDVRVRPIEGMIDWLPFKEKSVLDNEFLIRPARPTDDDLQGAAETFRRGFPVLYGGAYAVLYDAAVYPDILGAGEHFNAGDNFLMVAEHLATGSIAGTLMMRMDKQERTGEFIIISIDERFQGKGIGKALFYESEAYMESCGVEMSYIWITAKHTVTQRLAFDRGFVPKAIIPGVYRSWAGNDSYYRIEMAYFQKFYGGAEEMCSRKIELIPEAQHLMTSW
ncbi:hypothetical protein U14_05992 [Candidatus Moduliflexus flocculans]|uniref:N-acetyltransferase domain-containing protein n=1 Tax=Candidatus Moduliflexus flocculans TaxID=1499966 RepID=A0A081BTH3_9BACT|nr:hypothetical protein U14_05992 [Candidatus Moduliflexus flocculans]